MKFDLKHWATVLGAPAVAAFVNAFTQSGNLLTKAALEADGKVALAAFLAAIVAVFVPSPSQAAKLLPFVLIVGIGASTSACLSNAPIVPVTPANQSAVSQCQTDSNVHNGAVVGALISGAAGTAAGAIAVADSDPKVKDAMGVTGAVAAGVTAIGAGVIALENQLYQSGGCTQLLGPLPVLGKDGKPVARGFVPGDFR